MSSKRCNDSYNVGDIRRGERKWKDLGDFENIVEIRKGKNIITWIRQIKKIVMAKIG